MPTYPEWSPTYPGWNVETTHPITDDEDDPKCNTCADTVEPTLLRAIDWGSTASGSQLTDPDGTIHLVVVRYPTEEP